MSPADAGTVQLVLLSTVMCWASAVPRGIHPKRR